MEKILEEFTKNVKEEIMTDFGNSELFENSSLKGENNELILIEKLKKYLPPKYNLVSGKVFDSENNLSDQIDIIICDNFHNPSLIQLKSAKIVPAEIVYAVISVKTTLSTQELIGGKGRKGCIDNIGSVKRLKKNPGLPLNIGLQSTFSYKRTLGFVFAFDSRESIETLAKNFVEANEKIDGNEIDCICIFNKGLIINDREIGRVRILEIEKGEDHKVFLSFVLNIITNLNNMPMTTLDLTKYVGETFWIGYPLSDIPRKCFLQENFITDYRTKVGHYKDRLRGGREELKN